METDSRYRPPPSRKLNEGESTFGPGESLIAFGGLIFSACLALLGIWIGGETGMVIGCVVGFTATIIAIPVLKAEGFFDYARQENPEWITVANWIIGGVLGLAVLIGKWH